MTPPAPDPGSQARPSLNCSLTPTGRIVVGEGPLEDAPPLSASAAKGIIEAFATGRGQGVLHLGAAALAADLDPTLEFCRDLGQSLIAKVCAALDPNDPQSLLVPEPDPEELNALAHSAPHARFRADFQRAAGRPLGRCRRCVDGRGEQAQGRYSRLSQGPQLHLFTLRGVEPAEMIAAAVADISSKKNKKKSGRGRILKADEVSSVFGIDLDMGASSDGEKTLGPKRRSSKRSPKKKSAKPSATAARKKKTSRTKNAKTIASADAADRKKPAAKKRKVRAIKTASAKAN